MDGFKPVEGGCEPETKYIYQLKGERPVTVYAKKDIPRPSDLCGFGIKLSCYAQDGCTKDECSSSFYIAEPTPVKVTCPEPVKLEACYTGYKRAFETWVDGFKPVEGGCEPEAKYVYQLKGERPVTVYAKKDIPRPSDICGFAIQLTCYAQDGCTKDECSSSFYIAEPTPVKVTCPEPVKLEACYTGYKRAFETWVDGFKPVEGGCEPEAKYVYQLKGERPVTVYAKKDIPRPSDICGFAIQLTCYAQDGCTKDECSSSFYIAKPDELKVHCPKEYTVPACSTQDEVDMAFERWLNVFKVEGGCYPEAKFNQYEHPKACGSKTEVIFYAKDKCDQEAKCVAYFIVAKPDELKAICPPSYTMLACATQEDIDKTFKRWIGVFSTEGGCERYKHQSR